MNWDNCPKCRQSYTASYAGKAYCTRCWIPIKERLRDAHWFTYSEGHDYRKKVMPRESTDSLGIPLFLRADPSYKHW